MNSNLLETRKALLKAYLKNKTFISNCGNRISKLLLILNKFNQNKDKKFQKDFNRNLLNALYFNFKFINN